MTIATHGRHTSGQVHSADNTPPIWREAFWPAEWMSLRTSSVYYGNGVPRGDGSAVVVVPGFLCSDAVMYELHAWLGRIGYEPYFSGIGINATCPARTAERLGRTVVKAFKETGRPVRIVGHSLGGIIGRQVCIDKPEIVSQLVYLGTPLRAVHAHPAVVAAANMLNTVRSLLGAKCMSSQCECDDILESRGTMPETISHAAIYTRKDGVVDWQDARERNPWLNHEVGGTHMGLVYNPRAYRTLGELLAEATA